MKLEQGMDAIYAGDRAEGALEREGAHHAIADGERWRRHRGRTQAAASPDGLSSVEAAVKRLTDLLLASLLLLAAAPVLALIAVSIRLTSPGPILFCQQRAGLHGTAFRLFKFRTMHHAAADPGAVRQTERGDRRVTWVGRILRRHSLDELPQLFNVLGGSMSIVGPRPHALAMTVKGQPLDFWLPHYNERHAVKPGITGLAQISGRRGNVETVEHLRDRVAFDLDYIARWSVWLDLRIVAGSIRCVLHDESAF